MIQRNILYFAYGSNLSEDRLNYRVGKFEQGIPFVLKDYELNFEAVSRFHSNSFANIAYKKGASVPGVLYELTPYQFDMLDKYEALYERHYFTLPNGRICCTYISYSIETDYCNPDIDYIDIIINGYKRWGFNVTDYLKSVREKASKEFSTVFTRKSKKSKKNRDVVRTAIRRQLNPWP